MTKHDTRDAFDMTPIIENHPEAERSETEKKAREAHKNDANLDSKVGYTGGTQERTREGTEDAQKRSDSGAGL